MKWAFIDYENIGNLGKVDLSPYEQIIVFLGANQTKLNFDDLKYDNPIKMCVIQIKEIGLNNLDFHLAYYLGLFDMQASKKVEFEVISNDSGFELLIEHINGTIRPCNQLRVARQNINTDKLIQRILSTPKQLRPVKVESMRNYIASYFGIKGDEVAIQGQLNKLIGENVIEISGVSVEYPVATKTASTSIITDL